MNSTDFCKLYGVDRKNTSSLKWDALKERFGESDLISMWVADMDFKAPEQVLEAMHQRIAHGVFGYSFLEDSYFESVSRWQNERHGLPLKKEWIRFSTGVVGALYWFINAFTEPGESVMIITPVYYPFHNAVKDTGRNLIKHELENIKGVYSLNYDLFEKNIIKNKVKLFIQCSPHNPVGKVWKEDELAKIFEICQKHNVIVISDEIHQDIIMPGHKQIPAMLVENGKFTSNTIMVTSASKTFNLAGLIHSHIIIPDETLRKKYDEYAKTVNQTEVNIIGAVATQAAYDHGAVWLDGLIQLIKENYDHIVYNFNKDIPEAIITPMEGTYLMWIDLRAYLGVENTKRVIQNKCRLAVDYGEWFSDTGAGFIRLNLATKPEFVVQAVNNIVSGLKSYGG